MNRLFLSIGVLLVLVLTAALVVPLFVDWSAYRQTFEEQASALLGRRVQVSGATDLRLLPTPTIRFEGVEVAGAEGAPALLTAERFEAVLSIAPFLKGEIEVLDLVVERPVLRLPLGPDGALLIGESRPSGPFTVDLAAISVEAASISEGAIILILPDGTQRPLAGEVRAGLSAPSAIGPWRLDAGSLRLGDGEIVDFRAATGTAEDGAIRLRFSAYPAQTPVIVEADGALSLSGGLPRYDGEAVLRSAMEGGWRLVSGFELTPDRLRAENLTWSLQTGEGPAFEIAGHAVVALADPPRFEAVLSSRQIDLDRLFGGGPADPSASFEAVRHFLAGLPPLPVQGVVSADLPAIVVGGSVIRDIGFDVQLPG
ncbi:MAG: AsmA family protein, partial [Hyphomicrobiaceae bacterium]|nr:AsmA family protein [Hyphomicrobiaceae bacterium]